MCGDDKRLEKVLAPRLFKNTTETLRKGLCGEKAVRVRRWRGSYSLKCMKQKEYPYCVVVHLKHAAQEDVDEALELDYAHFCAGCQAEEEGYEIV